MENFEAFASGFLPALASGLVVLMAERLLVTSRKRAAASGKSGAENAVPHESVIARGRGNAAVVRQGDGSVAYVDQSRRTTTIRQAGGSHALPKKRDPDEFWLWAFGAVLGASAVALGFVWSENILRVIYAALWGAVLTLGVVVLVTARGGGLALGWRFASALPWVTACTVSAYFWGRWTGSWGMPLPGLQELGGAVGAVSVEADESWMAGVVTAVGEVAPLLLDRSNSLMPGVVSVVAVLVNVVMLAGSLVGASRALGAAATTARHEVGGWLAEWGEPYIERPWRTGLGAASAVVVVGFAFWVVTQPWFVGYMGVSR